MQQNRKTYKFSVHIQFGISLTKWTYQNNIIMLKHFCIRKNRQIIYIDINSLLLEYQEEFSDDLN